MTAAIHFVSLTAPAVALAQARPGATSASTGGDVIDLKSGGILRGTIIDAIPNGHARIQLATGEIATVPWQDIARIERGSAAPAAAATAPSAAEAPPVWVHIEGSETAQLQRDTSGNHREWTTVCAAPCDKAVSPQYEYRIAGDGIRNSRVFTLSAGAGEHETLTVDEGSRGSFALGIVSASVGGLVMVIGLVVVLANAAARLVDGSNGASTSGDRGGETLGWGISAVGLAGIIGGIVLIASNSKSGVTQSSASSPGGGLTLTPGAPMIGFRDAFRDGARESILKGAFAPAVGVPIFGGRF